MSGDKSEATGHLQGVPLSDVEARVAAREEKEEKDSVCTSENGGLERCALGCYDSMRGMMDLRTLALKMELFMTVLRTLH